MPLTRFRNGQRVRVSAIDHPMYQKCGVVVRLRRCDDQAWICMDDALPMDLRCFPVGDPAGRENHTLMGPEDCEAA